MGVLKPCTIFLAALGALSAARGADLSCNTPGVAQLVIPDTFAQNPSAKKLGLKVTGITILSVDESNVGDPVCQAVSVNLIFNLRPQSASWLRGSDCQALTGGFRASPSYSFSKQITRGIKNYRKWPVGYTGS